MNVASVVVPEAWRSSLGLSRRGSSLVWIGAVAGLGLSATVSVLAFVELLTAGSVGHLLDEGPLAVNPDIGTQLIVLFGSEGFVHTAQLAVHLVGFGLYAATAVLLVVRPPKGWVPVLGSVMLMAHAASLFAPLTLLYGTRWEPVARLVGTVSPLDIGGYWVSLAGLSLIALFLVFPTGTWIPKWSMWPVVAISPFVVVTAVAPGSPLNPATWPGPLRVIWVLGIPLAVVASQVYRALFLATDDERRAAAPVVGSFVVAITSFFVLWVLQPELTEGAFGLVIATPRLRAIYDLNLLILLSVAVFMLPVSIWFAVARHRLFDIELLTNRALVYGTLTGLLAGFFLVATSLIVFVAGIYTGDQLTGLQAVIAGGLTGASAVMGVRPLRARIQRVVDRRFYREQYDAQLAVTRFAENAADVVDLDRLGEELRMLLSETIHPETMRIWLGLETDPALPLNDSARTFLAAWRSTIDLSSKPPPELHRLRDLGYAVMVPLVSHRELVAAIALGPRRGGNPYRGLDLELLDTLAQRAAPAVRMAQLVRRQEEEALRQQEVAQELEVARRIQHDLLPSRLPELNGWEIEVHYEPAREVGGDFYDFIELPRGKLALVVGDVTDKGVPAAMVMATCRTLLRGAAGGGERSPAQVLRRVNDLLHPDIPAAMFATCLYGILEPDTGRFRFANAGHNLPYVVSRGAVAEPRATGLPLGLMPAADYDEAEVVLRPGDSLLLSTDGLVEAHGNNGEMFGFSRARAALEANHNPGLVGALLSAQRDFTGSDWEQEDDITLVALGRHGGDRS